MNSNPVESTQTTEHAAGSAIDRALKRGLHAAKANRWPALVLWLFGISIILAYSWVPAVYQALEQLSIWKKSVGWPFAVISTALVAGLLPPLIARAARQPQADASFAYLTSNLLFWAYKGFEVDMLYQLQAILFGDNSQPLTIATKVAFDQLVYAPLLGLTNAVLFYRLRDCGYSWSRFRASLGQHWFRRQIFPVLVSNWFVWVPACTIVYFLPLGLQLPIQNLILCFWVLMLVFFTTPDAD